MVPLINLSLEQTSSRQLMFDDYIFNITRWLSLWIMFISILLSFTSVAMVSFIQLLFTESWSLWPLTWIFFPFYLYWSLIVMNLVSLWTSLKCSYLDCSMSSSIRWTFSVWKCLLTSYINRRSTSGFQFMNKSWTDREMLVFLFPWAFFLPLSSW